MHKHVLELYVNIYRLCARVYFYVYIFIVCIPYLSGSCAYICLGELQAGIYVWVYVLHTGMRFMCMWLLHVCVDKYVCIM